MLKGIIDHLLAQRERLLPANRERAAQAPLPSIRALAGHYRVSTFTIQRALRLLAKRRAVYAVPRKGYFWGSAPPPPAPLPPKAAARPAEVEKEFLDDYRSGYLNPFARVPTLKTLAGRYHTSVRTVYKVMASLAAKGVLRRQGRGFAVAAPPHARSGNLIALITRCGPTGRLLLESDREMDFLKAVYQEAQSLALEVKILGYDESGQLRDREGGKTAPDFPGKNLLGFLVSTWLIPDARKILDRLKPLRQPISVWWEHPAEAIVKRGPNGRIAYFNLAFGEAPGVIVAETLLAQGHAGIAFISPFHASPWSRQRLLGLETRMRKAGSARVFAATSDSHASPWSFRHEAWLELRAGSPGLPIDHPRVQRRADRNLARRIRSLLRGIPGAPDITAWVCVNDQVAEIAMELADPQPHRPLPYLISFDNSVSSYRRQIDSFAFNTNAMVRDMLYHLINPSARVFSKKSAIEIVGRVVRK